MRETIHGLGNHKNVDEQPPTLFPEIREFAIDAIKDIECNIVQKMKYFTLYKMVLQFPVAVMFTVK